MPQGMEALQHKKRQAFKVLIGSLLTTSILFFIVYAITHQNTFEGLGVFAAMGVVITLVIQDILEKERKEQQQATRMGTTESNRQ